MSNMMIELSSPDVAKPRPNGQLIIVPRRRPVAAARVYHGDEAAIALFHVFIGEAKLAQQLDTADLTLQHEKLMAQQQDLDLFLPPRPTPHDDQLEQPPQRPIQKRERDPIRTAYHRR